MFVEDLKTDVDLAVRVLRKEKLEFDHIVVETGKDLKKALRDFQPDLIISDYNMPSFNGLEALTIVRKDFPELPFILYTGSVNEEVAVACIKAGADDYIIKEHMTRLPFAVNEALKQAGIRRDRKFADARLRESEAKLQSLFSSAPLGIGLLSDRVFLEVNEGFCRLTGYSRDEVIGMTTRMLYPSLNEYEEVGKAYGEIGIKGKGDIETRLQTCDGRILDVFITLTPLNKDDLSEGYTFTILDITERKKYENELKETNRTLRTLIGNLQGMVYRCRNDVKWTMEFVSEGSETLTGYQANDLVMNRIISYNELILPEHRDLIWESVQEAVRGRRHFEFTYRIRKKDGEIRWVWEKGEGIYDESGQLTFLEGFITDITERKLTEESLKISEEKFRSIAENLTDIIFITDSEGIVLYVSPSCKAFGYTQNDLTGNNFSRFIADGDKERAFMIFANALNGTNVAEVASLRFLRKDGTQFYAELSGSVFSLENGKSGVLGLIRDVSDKIRREMELRKLSVAVEQNPASVIITDLNGVIEYVNPQFCNITGYSPEELIGKNPNILSTHEKTSEEYRLLWGKIKSGSTWKGEFHNKKKNGDLYWESAIISPILNENGEITHFLGIKEDITLRKMLEEVTSESEKRYRELFLSNPIPTYIFDERTLEFIEVNDATVEFYGYTREEFSRMTLRDIRPEEDLADLYKSLQNLGSAVFHTDKMRHRRKNGEVFPVELTSHSLPEKNGRKSRLVLAHDITEAVKAAYQMELARLKAETSDKLKTTFLNNISHEVRTPLNGILGFAQIITEQELDEETRSESLRMLQESTTRLLDTITNYMDISLITSGSVTVYPKDFSPAEIILQYRDFFIDACKSSKLALNLDIPEDLTSLRIRSDPELFRKIILHLFSNAVKFTDHGSVSISLRRKEALVSVTVSDTGIGIAKGSLTAIFDKFVKEERNVARLTEGSGLGLSIVKGLSEAIGASVTVESEVGNGSCFTFALPTGYQVQSVIDSVNKSELKPAGELVILVAEDDDTNFYYLNALIKRETGARLIHAVNGKEAVDLFIANPDINLVLMDIKMPVMNGLDATRLIKAHRSNVPVIAVTAYAMSGDEARVLDSGCDSYLSKPLDRKALIDTINRFR